MQKLETAFGCALYHFMVFIGAKNVSESLQKLNRLALMNRVVSLFSYSFSFYGDGIPKDQFYHHVQF